jgi:hypothetical protein
MEPSEVAVAAMAMQLPAHDWATPLLSFEDLFADEAEPMVRLAMSLVRLARRGDGGQATGGDDGIEPRRGTERRVDALFLSLYTNSALSR